MKKEVRHAFEKEIYLLGKDKYGRKRWLEKPSWDCGWYWGFGYVESYTNNNNPEKAKDIEEHTHFDSLFLSGHNDKHLYYYDAWKDFFVDSVLTDSEIWSLMEMMKSYYLLRESASLFENGTSHITCNLCKDVIQSKDISDIINHQILPELFKKILGLLRGDIDE